MNYKYLIIGILIGGLVIVGASIAIGINGRDVETEENAYEAGMHYDDARKHDAELGWNIIVPRSLKQDTVFVPIEVRDRKGAVILDAAVNVELCRRGDHTVRKYNAVPGTDGRYLVAVEFDEPGCWDARIRVSRQNDTVRIDDMIIVQ